MVLMGEGGEGAQETSLSPMGCGGHRLLRAHTFVDCTRHDWQGPEWGYSAQESVARGCLAKLRKR